MTLLKKRLIWTFDTGPWTVVYHWGIPIRTISLTVIFRRVSRATSFDTFRCRLRMLNHGLSRLRQASSTCTGGRHPTHEVNSFSCSGETHLIAESFRNASSPKASQVPNDTPSRAVNGRIVIKRVLSDSRQKTWRGPRKSQEKTPPAEASRGQRGRGLLG